LPYTGSFHKKNSPSFYDPKYWDVKPDNLEYPEGVIVGTRDKLVPVIPSKTASSLIKPDNEIMYRGMSADEMASFLRNQELKSRGDYNLTGQEGLTYFTKDPEAAEYYANAFAPEKYKPDMEKPAYLVAAKRPPSSRIVDVPGTASHELGVTGPVPVEDVVGVYRGTTTDYTPVWREGGSYQAPSASLDWEEKSLDDILRGRASGGRTGYQTKGRVIGDAVDAAMRLVMGGSDEAAKSGVVRGTFPGSKMPSVDALSRNVDKFVYHSGTAKDIPEMKYGVSPQIGPWVREVLEGSADDDVIDEIMENAVPVSWWSKEPSWAVVKVARELGKPIDQVTPEDLASYGHVALIPKKDPEAESLYWVGEEGLSSGPYSDVEDITGRKVKAYDADLYSGNYGPEGVERNEYITTKTVEPYLHLTGNELVDFLRKTGQYKKASGGRTGYGPGGFVDDIVKMAGKIISGADEPAKTGIRAYQGSPHNFAAERLVRFPDKTEQYIVGTPDVLPDVPEGAEVIQDFPLGRMRMDKIGTGEGAQAYGHGLYAAGHEPVAQEYKTALSYKNLRDKFLEQLPQDADFSEVDDLIAQGYFNPEQTRFLTELRNNDWLGFDYPSQAITAATRGKLGNYDPTPELEDAASKIGHMYEVNINADPDTFLDWDKPLSEQSEAVKNMLARLPGAPDQSVWPYTTGNDLYEQLRVDAMGDDAFTQATPQRLAARKAAAPEVTRMLGEASIPGIKYLDAGSRGAGDGTRNYVVFDDKLISIIRKYGIAGASAMLGYNLMEQLDPKQALAASMADQDYQSSRPQRSMGGNNSISGALNVARGLHGGM
jgi:hypothetical protein